VTIKGAPDMYVKSGSPVTLHCQISSYLQTPSHVEWILNGTQLIRVKMVGTNTKSYNQQQQQQQQSMYHSVLLSVFHLKLFSTTTIVSALTVVTCNCKTILISILKQSTIRLLCKFDDSRQNELDFLIVVCLIIVVKTPI